MAALRVDPGVLRRQAAAVEAVRAAISPHDLPAGFSPAGGDAASAAHATSISAQAAQALTGLWQTWAALGKVSQTLSANAAGYEQQDDAGVAALSGGVAAPGATPAVVPEVAPVVTPHVYTGVPATTPEALARSLREGAGAQSPQDFAERWRAHAGRIAQASTTLAGVRTELGGYWSGTAEQGAQGTISALDNDLGTHHGAVASVSDAADQHAATYRNADYTIPTPEQFDQWHNNLATATAADAAYPGVYTPAVMAAQQDLSNGYTATSAGYSQYATDPVTGDLVDTATGQHFDPTTGEPIDAAQDDAEAGDGSDPTDMLGSMAPELLSGLLGGALGAVSAGVGAVVQGGQQMAQMATQGLGALTKAAAGAGGDQQGPDLNMPDLSGGGGMGEMGGGGGGPGDTMPAAAAPPGIGTAPEPPMPTLPPVSTAGPATAGGGVPMSGMGAPMMPMGGAGGGGGAERSGASANGKKIVAPKRPNTQKVLGQPDTERLSEKRERRETRMREVKREAIASAKEDSES